MLMERLNYFIDFDEGTGILTAAAGITLDEIIQAMLPRGWFPHIVPGTRFVTLGGCVASDVHGKNHHDAGSFGNHVVAMTLITADGQPHHMTPHHEAELFYATVGGMGLTGIITTVSIRMRRVASAMLSVRHVRATDLEAMFLLFEDTRYHDEYSVAWLDSIAASGKIGRGIVMLGHHSEVEASDCSREAPLVMPTRRMHDVPVDLPGLFLNPFTIKLFNKLYYSLHPDRTFVADLLDFFFPLDSIGHWNRLYGKQGFIQFQCVLPKKHAFIGVQRILEKTAATRHGSFLSVLKRLGPGNPAFLSFPVEGYTLAMDIPLSGSHVFEFLNELDRLVLEYGGRIYLAKDARMSPSTFRAMYGNLHDWLRVKKEVDPESRFQSALSRRLRIGDVA